jgi:hypothetical protein
VWCTLTDTSWAWFQELDRLADARLNGHGRLRRTAPELSRPTKDVLVQDISTTPSWLAEEDLSWIRERVPLVCVYSRRGGGQRQRAIVGGACHPDLAR